VVFSFPKNDERESVKATPTENYRDFYEQVATNYPEEELVFSTLKGLVRREFVLAFLHSFSGLFMDLGCNRGYYTAAYKNGPAVGVDLAFAVLKKARTAYPGIGFIQGDAQRLSFFKCATVDAIVCSEMIEHVPDPQAVFDECYRILKPRGQLLVTTPNCSDRANKPTWVDLGEMCNYGIAAVREGKYFHTAFRPEELAQLASKSGFNVAETGTFEKEVKYATRIPVIIHYMVGFLNRNLVRSSRLEMANRRFLERSSLAIYRACVRVRLNSFLTGLVREGVRSYVLVQKPGHGHG